MMTAGNPSDMTPTQAETDLWIAFNDLHRGIHREIERQLAANDLPPLKWYDVLWAVDLSGDEGVRAQHLRDWLLFEQSNLSRLLARLVQDGLIKETRCPQDGRAKTLTITATGKALRLRMWQIYGAQIHRQMQALRATGQGSAMLEAFTAMLEQSGWSTVRRQGDDP